MDNEYTTNGRLRVNAPENSTGATTMKKYCTTKLVTAYGLMNADAARNPYPTISMAIPRVRGMLKYLALSFTVWTKFNARARAKRIIAAMHAAFEGV